MDLAFDFLPFFSFVSIGAHGFDIRNYHEGSELMGFDSYINSVPLFS